MCPVGQIMCCDIARLYARKLASKHRGRKKYMLTKIGAEKEMILFEGQSCIIFIFIYKTPESNFFEIVYCEIQYLD